jgi:hypothetical protein
VFRVFSDVMLSFGSIVASLTSLVVPQVEKRKKALYITQYIVYEIIVYTK